MKAARGIERRMLEAVRAGRDPRSVLRLEDRETMLALARESLRRDEGPLAALEKRLRAAMIKAGFAAKPVQRMNFCAWRDEARRLRGIERDRVLVRRMNALA